VRRVLAIVGVLVAASAFVVLAAGAGDDAGAYRVRAIFMNAFSVIPGEDVKIAGVKVGKVESLSVTPDQRAAVVLRIDKPGFKDFRADATCQIRPQSLIGEKFVECAPTQPRPEGAQLPPPLRKISDGAGTGQVLLPVERTSKTVDLDLVNNTLRLPERQRLAIIINELGTGLAGRGADLRLAIRNADPALKATDQVLAILAGQNRTLAKLARDSDVVLAPLARDRRRVANFVVQAQTTAQATAERSEPLEQSIAELPAFLRELDVTMRRLGGLADQATPVLGDLGAVAPDVNRVVAQLGPFSQAATPALTSLGEATKVGQPALVKAKPVVDDLGGFATAAKPLSRNLSSLLTSLKTSGGIERLMDFFFYSVAGINGFDEDGHYLRAGLIVNQCSLYSTANAPDCSANFGSEGSAAAASAASAKRPARAAGAARPGDAAVAAAASATRGDRAGADPSASLLGYLLGGGG
jgi:virulence factor Mce-like protein